MTDGQKIQFTGEGDQEPNLEPGDIIIVLDEKDHPIYKYVVYYIDVNFRNSRNYLYVY